jgi:hypothetical protein
MFLSFFAFFSYSTSFRYIHPKTFGHYRYSSSYSREVSFTPQKGLVMKNSTSGRTRAPPTEATIRKRAEDKDKSEAELEGASDVDE